MYYASVFEALSCIKKIKIDKKMKEAIFVVLVFGFYAE